MSSLTDGFNEAQLYDHGAESSVDRILRELDAPKPLAETLLAAFDGEGFSQKAFEKALLCAKEAKTPPEQLAQFLKNYSNGLPLFQPPHHFPKIPSGMNIPEEASSLEEKRRFYNRLLPNRLGEAVRAHIFPEDPLGLLQFTIEHDGVHESAFVEVLKSYGEDPYRILFKAWSKLDEEAQDRFQAFRPDRLIWRRWTSLNRLERTPDSLNQQLQHLSKWHETLLDQGQLNQAEDLERLGYTSVPDLCEDENGIQAIRLMDACQKQMRWQRLRRPEARNTVDKNYEWLELSFRIDKSFLEITCSPEQADQYIDASLKVIDWRGSVLTSCLEANLHSLWCGSRFKNKWLKVIEHTLTEALPAEKLRILHHLFATTHHSVQPPLGSREGALSDDDYAQRRITLSIDPVPNAWLDALKQLGESYWDRKSELDYGQACELLQLLVSQQNKIEISEQSLILQADRILAELWRSQGHPPTIERIEASVLAQRILLTKAPTKMLRNLLQGFRKSSEACSGEGLEYGAGGAMVGTLHQKDHPHWWLCVMISNCLRVPYAWKERSTWHGGHKHIAPEEIVQLTRELRESMSEFCWKSLRLHKGQQCEGEQYSNAQCTEQNPLWRQAFAKALAEIGLDLGGKVHKTLHFVRQKDPSEEVRKSAKEAYKAVRRQRHSAEEDPIKGLLIAFWWLRLAQRKAMNLEIVPTSATRTRRDELKYATMTNEVSHLILT